MPRIATPPTPPDSFAYPDEPNDPPPPEEMTFLGYADAKERALDAFHARYLGDLLKATGGNISESARRAGLDRSNFRRVLHRYLPGYRSGVGS